MPILGRSGESIGTRLFGPAGQGEASKKLLTIKAPVNVAKRVSQGLKTAGGFLGAPLPAQASGPVVYDQPKGGYTPAPNYTPAPISAGKGSVDFSGGGSSVGGGGQIKGLNARGGETESELEFLRKRQLSAIDDEYDDESGRLKKEEGRAKKVYGETIAQAEAYYPEFQRLIGEQQTGTENQIGGLENARKYESERAMSQARQLLADLNRRQFAEMSARGTYGSSVPEAFADQFGNKAYAALGGIQQSRDTSLNELANKRIEAKQYFEGKLFEGKQKYDSLITGLKQQLNAQLDAIGQAKGAASSAKRAASIEAWNNYVNNKFSLDQELRNYQSSLTQYMAESADLEHNTFGEVTAPGIDASQNSQILGDINQQVNPNANPLAMSQAPIYTRKRLSPEEQELYGGQTEGLGLSSAWA